MSAWFVYRLNQRGEYNCQLWYHVGPEEVVRKEERDFYRWHELKPGEEQLSFDQLQKLYPPPRLINETSDATVVEDLGDVDGKTG